jgi:uncharacterized protein (TIGR00251 family)
MAKTVRIKVKVVPRSGNRRCIIDTSGALKCYLKSPPEDGAANAELIKYFAHTLKITQKEITITSGATSRNKTLALTTDLSLSDMYVLLGCEVQHALF